MRPSLRSQMLLSTLTMVVVGLLRPAFNAANTHAFGAAANGRAAWLLSLVFVASLPATSGLPSLVVLQVGKALGRKDEALARAYARYGALLALPLALLGALGALGWNLLTPEKTLGLADALLVGGGVLAYTYWRLARSLFVAIDRLRASLVADLASMALAASVMVAIVLGRLEAWSIVAFLSAYVAYGVLTVPAFVRFAGRQPLPDRERREVWSYLLAWSLGTAASLATQEVALLLLRARAEDSVVGEVGVALSFLTPLAFAPRVIELPLIRELSRLGAEGRAAGRPSTEAVRLTARASHWLGVIIFSAAFTAAFLAEVLLGRVGHVGSRDVMIAFSILTLTFSAELAQSPAFNLVAAAASPWMLSLLGVVPFTVATAWWVLTPGLGLWSIIGGLVASHLTKVALGTFWASRALGLPVAERPWAKAVTFAVGAALLALVVRGEVPGLAAAPGFLTLVALVFRGDLVEMLAALRGRPTSGAAGGAMRP